MDLQIKVRLTSLHRLGAAFATTHCSAACLCVTLLSRTQQPLYLLMLDRRQVKSSPRQLPVSSKLVSAQNPFALFWIVRDYFDAVDPRHPLDDLGLVSPQVPGSFERYTNIYLSTAIAQNLANSVSSRNKQLLCAMLFKAPDCYLFSSAADQRRPLLVNLSLVLLDRFSKTGALEQWTQLLLEEVKAA